MATGSAKGPCTVDGCSKPSKSRGICGMHIERLRNHGTTDSQRLTVEQRYWAKVQKTPTCWNWIGAKNDAGYGQLRVKDKALYAHRMGYEMAHGKIPDGMLIDHTCHNPACVNPPHLRLANKKQNSENMLGATRKSRSGIRGVWRIAKSGRWTGQVNHRGVTYSVGTYSTAEECEVAAVELRNKLFTHNDVDRGRVAVA